MNSSVTATSGSKVSGVSGSSAVGGSVQKRLQQELMQMMVSRVECRGFVLDTVALLVLVARV